MPQQLKRQPAPAPKRNTATIRILCYLAVAGAVLIGWRLYTAPKSPNPADKRARDFVEQDALHRAAEQRIQDQQVIGG